MPTATANPPRGSDRDRPRRSAGRCSCARCGEPGWRPMSPHRECTCDRGDHGGKRRPVRASEQQASGQQPPGWPGNAMNGAQAMIRTLVDGGVTTCFTNPGTSEMHFVAALDTVPEMRGVLALFEGVATGAADGYARMADGPGATLLHLGSGLGNGLANLHNARKGHVPVVNIVGDHATYHTRYDAQLQSDIETVARNVSSWVRTSESTTALASDAAEAIAAATGPPGQVATLILPADVSWSDGASPASPPARPAPPVKSGDVFDGV